MVDTACGGSEERRGGEATRQSIPQEAGGREDDGEARNGSMEVGKDVTGESCRKGEAFLFFLQHIEKLVYFLLWLCYRGGSKGSKRVTADILYDIVPQY